jgi:phosphate transport system ATP-binding protein
MTQPDTESKEPIAVSTPDSSEPGAATEQGSVTPQGSSAQAEAPDISVLGAPKPKGAGHNVVLTGLNAFYGKHQAIKGVGVSFPAGEVTAIIGPSGCGKSTLIRCINRMHEEIPGAYAEGSVTLDDLDVYDPGVDITSVRRLIGMVFQKPNPFPTMSIFDNVAAGLRLTGSRGDNMRETVHKALRAVGLWGEVKNRLDKPGIGLSGGQQQRLCIARTIAVEPEVILMDEPCSALDPIATLKVEELIDELKERYTIVIVTHNMQQAARVADTTVFMLDGELIEHSPTSQLFTTPTDERTERYVTGKFG